VCAANAERPWTNTSFGKVLPERGSSDRRAHRVYMNVRLVNVPSGAGGAAGGSGPGDYDA